MTCWRIRGLALGGFFAFGAGCGDDTTSPLDTTTDATDAQTSTTDDGTTGAMTDSSTGESSSGDQESSSSSSEVADSSSSSSSGTPNEPPTADPDLYVTDTIATTPKVPLVIDATDGLLANDADPEADALVISDADATTLAGGTIDVAADGSFTYTPPDPFWGEDGFGYVVSDDAGAEASGSVRIVVAPTAEDLAEVGPAQAGFRVAPAAAGDHVGVSVAGGGDINGDGFADLLIGADDVGAGEEGAAYVVFGKTGSEEVDLAMVAGGTGGFVILGETDQAATGYSLAFAGDVNADGLGDIVIGSVDDDGDVGRAYVVFGKADTNAVDLAAVAGGTGGFVMTDSDNPSFGFSVAGAGDVNGDGLADVIVGEPGANGNLGRAIVIHGRALTSAIDAAALGTGGFVIEGFGANARAGFSVAGAGDFDGDGLGDVLVGAPGGSGGAVGLVLGRTETTPVTQTELAAGTGAFLIGGSSALDDAGYSVGCAGDLDGDGRHDVIIGAPGAEGDKLNASGLVYVLYGKADTSAVLFSALVNGVGGLAIEGEADFDLLGWSVGAAGDVNGDGLGDAVFGAQGADFGAPTAGRTYVMFGRADGRTGTAQEFSVGVGGFVVDGEGSLATAGWSGGAGGDVNGDSFADFVVGSPRQSSFSGVAHVVFGGDFGGLTPGDTDGDDVIIGTAQNDVLTGGRGSDELHSLGGSDVLYSGEGDDVIVLAEPSFFRIDGGLGEDTIRLDGADLNLDLGNFSLIAIAGVETIDITGSGDNGLFMSLSNLRVLSSETPSLSVVGDAGDQLVVDLAGGAFVNEGSDGTNTTYSNGVLSLVVSDAVEVFADL